MKNDPFIDGLPIKNGDFPLFSMAMLNNQMVYIYIVSTLTAVNPTSVRRRIGKILINSSTCFRCCASEALVRTGLSGNSNKQLQNEEVQCKKRVLDKFLTEGRQLAGKYALSCSRDIASRYRAVTLDSDCWPWSIDWCLGIFSKSISRKRWILSTKFLGP